MDTSMEELFILFREMLTDGASDAKIIKAIKANERLIEASNSYCVQCGKCCYTHCENKETGSDGLVQCSLHDDSGEPYPHGKLIPIYPKYIYERLDYERLDSREYAKPLVCHTTGPYLVFLALIHYEGQGNLMMVKDAETRCFGAVNMLRDYKIYLSTSG